MGHRHRGLRRHFEVLAARNDHAVTRPIDHAEPAACRGLGLEQPFALLLVELLEDIGPVFAQPVHVSLSVVEHRDEHVGLAGRRVAEPQPEALRVLAHPANDHFGELDLEAGNAGAQSGLEPRQRLFALGSAEHVGRSGWCDKRGGGERGGDHAVRHGSASIGVCRAIIPLSAREGKGCCGQGALTLGTRGLCRPR
jgi:hypothetical protein